MKKILGIVPYTYLPAITGGHKAVASMYNNLDKGFKIAVIGTKNNASSKATYELINLFSSSPLRYINLLNFFTIRNIIKERKIDYLQIEHPYLGWLAILLKFSTGVKLIVRSHNIEGLRFKNLNKWWWNILLKYEGFVHKRADLSYFITEEDRQYAIKNFKLAENKTYNITFGVDQERAPLDIERREAKRQLRQTHQLQEHDVILLFNGAFDYKPNINALQNLVNTIFPELSSISNISFKLIICGKGIPEEILSSNSSSNIIYAGFVKDINTYLIGADIFLNPINEGGGIKTKLVEALSFNATCVSFISGANGIPTSVCGEKLLLVPDNEPAIFAEAITAAREIKSDIPDSFYNQFSNSKILEKIKGIL